MGKGAQVTPGQIMAVKGTKGNYSAIPIQAMQHQHKHPPTSTQTKHLHTYAEIKKHIVKKYELCLLQFYLCKS